MAMQLDVEALKYQLNPYQRNEAASDLRRAADLIEQVGWWQKEPEGPGGQMCLSTALAKVTGSEEDRGLCYHSLDCRQCLALTAIAKYTGRMAVSWNDDEAMTKETILAGMRSCAAWLDKLARED